MPDGKPENKFAFDGEFQDAEFAGKILTETHSYWKQLLAGEEEAGKLSTASVLGSLAREEAGGILAATPTLSAGPLPADSVHTWHYIHLQQ